MPFRKSVKKLMGRLAKRLHLGHRSDRHPYTRLEDTSENTTEDDKESDTESDDVSSTWSSPESQDSEEFHCGLCDKVIEGKIFHAPCKAHCYCRGCVRDLFLVPLIQSYAPTLFPNCCFEIFSDNMAARVLDSYEFSRFQSLSLTLLKARVPLAKERYLELKTIDGANQYCGTCGRLTFASCHAFSQFIGRWAVGRWETWITCAQCGEEMDSKEGWWHKTCVCGTCYESASV